MDKSCCYCENKFNSERKRTVEHLVPISKGGANNPGNLRDCCNRCNDWRGNKFHLEWAEELKAYALYGRAPFYFPVNIERMISNCIKYDGYIKDNGLTLIANEALRVTPFCDLIN